MLHFGSIGRQHSYEHSLDVLAKEHGLRRDRLVVVNVEDFPNVARCDECKPHAGFHKTIWQRIAKNGKVLKKVLGEMAYKMKSYIPEDAEEAWIVFECSWGKQRSVAMAEMTQRVVQRASTYETTFAVHYSKRKWSKWKCGRISCSCHDMNDEKREALDAVADAYNEVFAK